MSYPLLMALSKRRVFSSVASAAASRGGLMALRAFSTRPQNMESFLNGTSSLYAEQMYDQYCENPDSVHPSWKKYFENDQAGVQFHHDDYSRPSTVPGKRAAASTSVSSLYISIANIPSIYRSLCVQHYVYDVW